MIIPGGRLDRVFDAYEVAGVAAELATFFEDLPFRMAAAHLVIGRSGATTVAELSALGRPAVLPLPAFAARLATGEMADALLLSSQRVQPARLRELGYRFRVPDLHQAIKAALH